MITSRALVLLALALAAPGAQEQPLHRTVDLALGETAEVRLPDGKAAKVRLIELDEERDEVCGAIRRARVALEVNGERAILVSANYHLPVTVAGVQVDCPITKGYNADSRTDAWGLVKDARVRIWPAGSAWMPPGSFTYPARQRWFATMTQMANEPVYVDGGDVPGPRKVYYHYGLDIGGTEERVDVVSATDGTVVSSGKDAIEGYKETPIDPRYDVVYVRDARDWYCRYSHLKTIDVKLGDKVRMGQKIGLLGKEGGSGGWSHLHFDITSRQPSGKWGIQEGYAFLWEAYLREFKPAVLAVARPHHLVWAGSKVALDGSKSYGRGLRHEWTFTDGTTAAGAAVERTYEKPGMYSEVLKITDAEGRVDFDFGIVQVIDKANPKPLPPSIHPNYAPTLGIKPGDPVTFKVRTFRTQEGEEKWDFGDGTPAVAVKSDGNVKPLAPDGYAQTVHRFDRPGLYVVRVERSNATGVKAIGHVKVRVGDEP